jgi:hypothetical protein
MSEKLLGWQRIWSVPETDLPHSPLGAAAPRPRPAAYEDDFHAWATAQAELLRAGQPYSADLLNVAEEIEDLGKAERRSLESHISTVIEHLMKLQVSPASLPRHGWRGTVVRAREQIRKVLVESPSLRPLVPDIVVNETVAARRVVALDFADYGEPSDRLDGLSYAPDQVLTDWWPDFRR